MGFRPVLVVDDHPANRWIIGRLLERLGMECRFATDGTEAIAVAGMRRWGAFLMDIEMKRLDGDQAARQLRRISPYLAGVPIIAVTSLPMPEAIKRCRRAGIDGLVSKPVSIEALEEQLRTHAGYLFADNEPTEHPKSTENPSNRGEVFRSDIHIEGRLRRKRPKGRSMPRPDESDPTVRPKRLTNSRLRVWPDGLRPA